MRLAVLMVLALVSGMVFGVELGEKAPPIQLETWLNGTGVDPSVPDGKRVTVVVFWATWCPASGMSVPSLNRVARSFSDRNVTVLAVTSESAEDVQAFLDERKTMFAIGLDADGVVRKQYMRESDGIPAVFIVDAKGLVAWTGHPMSGLERVLGKILAGTFDRGLAEKTAQAEKELQAALQIQDYEAALATLDALIELEPDNFQYHTAKTLALTRLDRTDPEMLKAVFKRWAAGCKDCAEGLRRLVLTWRQQDYAARDPEAIMRAARRAWTLAGPGHEEVAAMMGQVYMDFGMIEAAVDTLKKALASAEDAPVKKALQDQLDYFTRIQRLHEP
jgi:peroxiredoxin